MGTKPSMRLPVVSHGAEYLVIGYLMRRNILAYKAPPNNEGYDLICIHPDPKKSSKQIRVQVKSRFQTDCDRAFPVKRKSEGTFDYLVVAFLNIGNFYGGKTVDGIEEPEFFTFPAKWIWKHHKPSTSGWERVLTANVDIEAFKNEKGFELIAGELSIAYPTRNRD